MCIKYFAFALLWFPGVLHAQSTTQACDAPTLDGGFFAPKQETYPHGTKLSYTCNEGRQLAMKGWWATSTCHNGRWSHEPQCIASSSTSDSNNRDSRPMLMNVQSCGARPYIENAVIVEEGPMYLKYQCNRYYKLAGPEAVSCYSDAHWSKLPTCEEAFCVVDPARYARYGLVKSSSEYMREGETKPFPCTTKDYYINVRCTNRRIFLSTCCPTADIFYEVCRVFREPN
ncbi:complement factor H-like isoform X2 [Oreochromis aureus]|uniref:complement factor H-like isoform X2 n=1 Tax=Oreochromis aureus TaxID=47969 RepID=UPI001954C927|nr:complement factor H-like isoform X2 [Oreochromis aureus]